MRDEDFILLCDVKLPPATTIRAGCTLATLKLALAQPGRPRHFEIEPQSGPVPSCGDCANNKAAMCVRSIGRHFDAKTNGYRSRLSVICVIERSRERDLTKRQRCGPSARFFEPKGSLAPIGGMQGTVIIDEAAAFARVHDTLGDSDGDDGA